jgi:AcrR family transcriptional regulator
MSTEAPRSAKAAQSQATRAGLLAAARSLFAERGYAHVGTEEIVRAAGVTRGALYHQFADKRDLFSAVFEELEAELIGEAAQRMVGHDDPLDAMKEACRGWLEACARPEAQQIVLLDAPAVLGYETWREIGERHGLGAVMAAVQAAIDAGALEPQPVRALAHVLVGALDEAALYVARSDDPETALAEMDGVLSRMVDSLRP